MSRFLETIRVRDGVAMHLEWHQQRVASTLRAFYPEAPVPDLAVVISAARPEVNEDFRCRILYDDTGHSIEFLPLRTNEVRSLRLVDLPPDYDYRYKYADRRVLELAYSRRGDADDVLLVRDGWITDTSVANVAFLKEGRWYTPALPLLAGTTWKRLVQSDILVPRPIHVEDLPRYDACALFNALRAWEEAGWIEMYGIN